MNKLTKQQRNHRDKVAAYAAVNMANNDGLTAAIAVDDIKAVKRMLKRVERIVDDMQLEYDVEQHAIYVDVLTCGIFRS